MYNIQYGIHIIKLISIVINKTFKFNRIFMSNDVTFHPFDKYKYSHSIL